MTIPVVRRTLRDSSAQLSWSKVAPAPVVEKVSLKYPIFWTLASATTDPKWLQILESFYNGKFLPKFSCTMNVLKYRKDKKTFSCSLDPDTPMKSYEVFHAFVGKHSGIISEQEIEEYERQAEIESEHMAKKSWSDHTQVMKNCMLEVFYTVSAEMAQLNHEEKKQLRSLVKYGIISGYLKGAIMVENNQIQYIAGLHFDEINRKFYLDSNLKPRFPSVNKKKSTKAKTSVSFDRVWSKVCEHYPNLE